MNFITTILKFGKSFAQVFGLCKCLFECGKVTLAVCLFALFLSFTYDLLMQIRAVPGNVRHEHILDPPELIRNERDLFAGIEPVNEVVEEGWATSA